MRAGTLVQVIGEGTARFPVPLRYQGRTAEVLRTRKVGNTQVVELDFSPRRANPLPVTASQIEVLE